MLTNLDRHKVKTRAKKWDRLGFRYKSINQLSKKHSLNCGCAMCKSISNQHNIENKSERLKSKMYMNEIGKFEIIPQKEIEENRIKAYDYIF